MTKSFESTLVQDMHIDIYPISYSQTKEKQDDFIWTLFELEEEIKECFLYLMQIYLYKHTFVYILSNTNKIHSIISKFKQFFGEIFSIILTTFVKIV